MAWPTIDVSTLMLALGLALLAWILLRRSHAHARRTSTRHQAALERLPRTPPRTETALANAPPELASWQIEMYQTARDLTAELDTKISVLRQLLLMAAQERTKLEDCLARSQQLGPPAAMSDTLPPTCEDLSASPRTHPDAHDSDPNP